MKKKVLLSNYNLCIGGIEKSLLEILKAIDMNKYEVSVLLEEMNGEYLGQVPENVELIHYYVHKDKNILIRKFKNFIKQRQFKKKYGNKFDLSICYAPYSLPCNKASRIASLNRTIFIHGNYPMIYKYDSASVYKFFADKHLDEMNHIVFVSNEARNDFLVYFPEYTHKTMVINNLVDSKKIIKKANEKVDLKKPSDSTLLVFVGRLEEDSKRITRQLSLIEYLNKEKVKTNLWIIGEGQDRKLIEKIIKKKKLRNVFMLGAKTNPYPYLKMADYMLLTSDYEGFPVVFNEALVLGKQVITTIAVSDDAVISCNNFFTIKKERLNKEALEIIKNKKQINYNPVDFIRLNKDRIKRIEELIDMGDQSDKV